MLKGRFRISSGVKYSKIWERVSVGRTSMSVGNEEDACYVMKQWYNNLAMLIEGVSGGKVEVKEVVRMKKDYIHL